MAIEAHAEPGRLPLADRLRALFARRVRGVEGAELATFARQLLGRGAGYIERLADEEAAALVLSAFRFYAAPGPELRVRVLTPTYADAGWDGPFTVIETVMSDRAFIVDTIRCRLAAAGVEIETFLHPIFAARRDAHGGLELLAPPEGGAPRESFAHVAVTRTTDVGRLAAEVRAGLEDVRLVTDDFAPMVARAQAIAAELDKLGRTRNGQAAADATAVADFLRWLVDGAFVFLGYREYGLTTIGGATQVQLRAGSGLGLLRREDRSALRTAHPLDELPEWVRGRLRGDTVLTVTKTTAEAPVHRRVPMDDIGIRELDADGRVIGERRFIGLFTSKAYAEESAEIPLLRRMLRQILAAEHVVPGSHDHKEIVAVFNALPKSLLFASTAADVRAEIQTVLTATRAEELAVAVQARPESQRVTVLVVLPRARFSHEARQEIRNALATRLGGTVLDDHVALPESGPVLLHYAFASGGAPVPAEDELRAAVLAAVRTWEEAVRDALEERLGVDAGARLAARWTPLFTEEYRAGVSVARAVDDVVALDAVAGDGDMRVALRDAEHVPGTTELRVYVGGAPLVLSEFMPVLENLGLRALAEDQVVVAAPDGPPLALQSFFVQDRHGRALDAKSVAPRLTDALRAQQAGRAATDVLDRLVLAAGLDWRAVAVLRAYAGYAVQAGIAARPVVLGALAAHAEPARRLYEAFAARLRPGAVATDPAPVRQTFVQSLESVQALRDDLVLRALFDVVQATVRTNFFAPGPERDHVAIKIRAADLAQLPPPRPLYEIYVHGPTVEGIHLRAGKVARGGIRWSDRPEDFRTEVLGLMKTQIVKNAIIVPTGAKGGFVPKRGVAAVDAYRTFVGALLDLTDNLVAGRVVHPRGLVVHDEPDPYLVVAADRGTATFSDVANALAAEHGFWLGDAFASGGSHGYDHKALGITARGAWECVRTHFRELAIDADAAPLDVAGIGDPSGDVFGNGMVLSRALRLRAAFNHVHVFLDPTPDAARAFAERARLFRAAKGWDAYDPAALSPGGTVVARAAKRVVLSPEAQAMLGLPEPAVSGERLVQAVLTLRCDLLFNGGIGTYVAAGAETDAEVRDAVNDGVRVKANALRARVVGEGGNLGFTQRARIEYAVAGGRIDTDAIDNSGGVDMSDHEVNLKICLRAPVEDGRLTTEARNAFLAEVTDEVVARVLAHNRAQSRVLSIDQVRSRTRLADFRELAADLERTVGLDRTLEALPDAETLRARRATYVGLTRPELAVLMAYAKIQLQRGVLGSSLPDEPLLEPYLRAYFPARVVERFPDAVHAHPLRREIVATELANAVVDELGTTFVHRAARDTGATVADVLRAWAIGWAVADGGRLAVTGAFTPEVETTCRLVLERTSERVTKWILANTDRERPAADVATELGAAIARVRGRLPEWISGGEAEAFHRLRSELEIAGLPPPLAMELATADWLTGALDVVTVARETGVAPEEVAACYYGLGKHVDFAWLWARLGELEEGDRWQRRAVEGLVEDVLRVRRGLARLTLERGPDALPARPLAAVQDLLRDLRAAPRVGLAGLHVLVAELRRLAGAV